MGVDERLGFLEQLDVSGGGVAQPLFARGHRLIERAVEERFQPRAHSPAAHSSARFSHARAIAHCRFTVAGEMPTTSAVSSTVRPPK